MEYKKSALILILAIFLVSIAGVCAADANDTIVASENTNQGELSSINVISEDNLKTIEENTTLTQANDDETVSAQSDSKPLNEVEGTYEDLKTEIGDGGDKSLAKRYYRYTGGTTIEIKNSGVINGNGAVIDMAGSNIQAFYVSASPVYIKNLTIKNVNYTNDGGAIYFNYYGNVTNCNFINNSAKYGGAIYFSGSGAVENCNFVDNSAKSGGAVDFEKESNINNCNFTNNTASKNGGAIWIYTGNVTNCIFTLNKASDSGGAVYSNYNGNVSNCNFTNNSAKYGGAFYMPSGTVKNCIFTLNNASESGGAVLFKHNGTVINCNITNNTALKHGGAFYMHSGTVKNCNFANNTAYDLFGGAIFFYSSSTVENCNFINNKATADYSYGGAIMFFGDGTVTNCYFANNHAYKGGSILSNTWYAVTADTCIFKTYSDSHFNTHNLPPTLNVDNFTSFYNSSEKLTFDLKTNSSMPVYDGNISIIVYYKNNNSWVGNYSCLSGEGWTVDLPAGLYYAIFNTEYAEFKPINRTITIIPNHTFSALNDTINTNDAPEVNLTNDYCYDPAYGEDFIEGIVINRNVIINGNGHTIDAQGKARVFNVQAEDVTINNLTIVNANVTGDGGAIYFAKSGRVINCNFINNSASDGGAVYFYKHTEGNVINCNFTNNNASESGGAICFDEDSTGNVTDCNFVDNTASVNGGAVCFLLTGTVTNCTFSNNSASWGGGILIRDGTSEVINCSFTSNSASVNGGAVYFYKNGDVTNCNFANNSASLAGGAFLFEGDCTVENCNFTGNNARTGSAIFGFNGKSTIIISNSIFLNNRAGVNSKAPFEIVYEENKITITFIGNNDDINAICSYGVSLYNVTYWGANGIANTDDFYPSSSYGEAGQNITVSGFVNDDTLDIINVTDADGKIFLGDVIGDYWISVRHDSDSYYTEAETVITNIYANVTEINSTNRTVNLTAKSNIHEIMPGSLMFILPNGDEINATYVAGGIWWAVHEFDEYKDYQVNASYIGLRDVAISNATISITKANSTLDVSDVVLGYGEAKNVTVTAEGATGITAMIDDNPIGVVDNYTIMIPGLNLGNYTLTVTTMPDENHLAVNRTATITVKKANSTIILDAPVWDYGTSINVTVTATGAKGITAEIYNGKTLEVDGYIIRMPDDLDAGQYGMIVTTIPDENHNAVNRTVPLQVNRANSTVDVSDVSIEYGATANVTVTATGAKGITAKIGDKDAEVDGYSIAVPVLDAGNYTLTVTTVPNDNHDAVTGTAKITVNRAPAEISIVNETIGLKTLDFVGDVASLAPEGAGNLTYLSSDEGVVVVYDGIILATGPGTAAVIVSFGGNSNYRAASNKTITVNVTFKDASVSVENSTLDLKVGDRFDLNATTVPGFLNVEYVSGNGSVATVTDYGIVTAVGEGTCVITLTVGNNVTYAVNTTNVTVKVSKIATEIKASSVSAVWNDEKNLVVALTDINGNPIADAQITVNLDGDKNYTTDENGQVNISTKGLDSKAYAANIIFNGNTKYDKSAKEVNVTVKKATPKIIAGTKTFKTTDKTKKYTITLKDNTCKPIKKTTVYLKVNGKTYKATTNSKGQATFKLTKLSKTGTATITYKGDKNHNKVTKKVKLTVTSGFKTVSKGSKDSKTVKKIQRALKNNGYYLSAYGHYLKVDGIYQIHTENAVKQFQKAKGLKVTGKVDEKTAKKLGII